ncbi:hypothetical protein NHX12_034482 [Muraenolepis orangiensis]|uniref:Centrosomal protein POC5 n=1 Tax=Muraenolepis orangiensis TaxID=630683 RepID=A0A9Q0DAL8_9TELE|nr:hypothetical protein NHX12_034482 [Muraenolepis orangiensis]
MRLRMAPNEQRQLELMGLRTALNEQREQHQLELMRLRMALNEQREQHQQELMRWRMALNEQHEQHQQELMRLRMALNEQREQHQLELMRLRMALNEQREQHQQELMRWRMALNEQREQHQQELMGLRMALNEYNNLLHTYKTSNQRKDEVIMNLTKALDRQKETMEVMRTFTTWRIRHSQAKEELKRKVWLGWHGLLQKHWKDKVERACRARAEEVCVRLSSDYEARIAQHCEAVEDAQAEIQKLRVDRERYEESMKKAFMRGVCALNMEALTMEALTMSPPLQARCSSSRAHPSTCHTHSIKVVD